MKYEKVVIKPKERRIKSMLRERGLDGAIVSSPENFHYVTGFAGHQHTAVSYTHLTLPTNREV